MGSAGVDTHGNKKRGAWSEERGEKRENFTTKRIASEIEYLCYFGPSPQFRGKHSAHLVAFQSEPGSQPRPAPLSGSSIWVRRKEGWLGEERGGGVGYPISDGRVPCKQTQNATGGGRRGGIQPGQEGRKVVSRMCGARFSGSNSERQHR